jgi:hypothetical protein
MVGIIISLLLVFPLWSIIHELSHITAAKLVFHDISPWKIIPWPHKHEGKFYWARCSYTIPLSASYYDEQSDVWSAPRIADWVLGGIFIIVGIFYPIALIFAVGAVIDIFVGTLGIDKQSDIQLEATLSNKNIWSLRIRNIVSIILFMMVIISILI